MEIVTMPSYAAMSLRAAEILCAAIDENPALVLGLPTGATPLGMYRRLVVAHERGQVNFSRVRTFNLDEYCGLAPDHPASYHAYMWENFCARVDLSPQQARIPRGDSPELAAECRAYEEAIAEAGYLELAVLGIGQNGHVGFNEPGAALQANVHVAKLSAETRALAYEYWRERAENPFPSPADVPDRAITMGMGTILKSKRILLLASGTSKAEAVRRAATGALTPQVPASFLQLHRDVTVLLDSAAGRLL